MNRLLFLCGCLLAAAPGTPHQDPQDEQIFTDDIHKEFVDKIKKAVDARDWRGLFARYDEALRRYGQKLIAHPERPDTRISLIEYLLLTFSVLPAEALEQYRLENDAKARLAFDEALESGDPVALQKALWTYFFASSADETLDRLALAALDRGRYDTAILYWNWLLRYYPDSEIPKTVTAARIATACKLGGGLSNLNQLRSYVRQIGLDGGVRIGRDTVRLSTFLDGIAIDPADTELTAAPLKLPSVPEPHNRHGRRILGVRNDVRRWVYDFAADKSENAKIDEKSRLRVRWEGNSAIESIPDYPILPAYARIQGIDYVLVTNGLRVIAFNPAAVRGDNLVGGVYWKYPDSGPIPHPPVTSSYSGYYAFSLPFIGATIEGEHAYVTLYSEKIRREVNQQTMDLFDGPTRLVCFHIPSGRVVWDTDRMDALFKPYEFIDRNYAYSAPPLVRGDRIYAGICTSPMTEEESRVLCLDRATGRPIWCTTVSSVTGGGRNAMFGNGQKVPAHLTLLAEEGGILYVQTNLGVVAAIEAVTGNIRWLSIYKRTVKRPNYNQQEPLAIRPPNPPLLYRGALYVLPQDANELICFDVLTGVKIPLPPARVQDRDLPWKTVTHLIGIVKDWMVLGGPETYVLLMRDYCQECKSPVKATAGKCQKCQKAVCHKAYGLPLVNTSKCGRAILSGETVYLPAYTETGGELQIYHGAGSWKQLAQTRWKGKEEYGNLLIAGDFLVVGTTKVFVYTDTERVRQEYIARIRQRPPELDVLLEYGTLMRENDKLEDAAEALLEFVRGAEGDPKYEAKVREVKVELYEIFMRRGEQSEGARAALGFYQMAREFSYDATTYSEATRKIARSHERLEQWREAVGEYQNLVRRGREQYFRPEGANSIESLWTLGRNKIAEILRKDAEAYQVIEKEASEALKKVGDGDVEALRKLRELYPNSKAAREAWKRIYDTYLKNGAWEKVKSLLEEFKAWYGSEFGFEHQLRMIEALDHVGDYERLPGELARLKAAYRSQPMGEETVSEYVDRRLREFESRTPLTQAPIRTLAKVGEMDAIAAPKNSGLAVGYVPLRPLGIVPPDFPAGYELFQVGSSIELWDLDAKRRVWSAPRPGGYVGVIYNEPKDIGQAGVTIAEVCEGSPAARAGLKPGDVILQVQGTYVNAELWHSILRQAAPGTKLNLSYEREKTVRQAECDVERNPVDSRPAVVGAAFTSDYELAVAWEDGAASLELATGRSRWIFSGIRDRFHVEAIHATEGRVYLYEAFRAGKRSRASMNPRAEGKQELPPAELHHRLFCLDDSLGQVEWIRAYDVTVAGACGLHFAADYDSDTFAVIEYGARTGTSDWVLSILNVSDGQPASGTKSVSLGGVVLAWKADLDNGMLYYVDGRDQNNRYLRSTPLRPGEKKGFDLLVTKLIEANAVLLQLAVERDHLVLVSVGTGTEPGSKIWLLQSKDGKEVRAITLPEGRYLPPANICDPVLEGGILYLYTLSKVAPKSGSTPPGFLTAIRTETGGVHWEAMAPSVPLGSGTSCRLVTAMGDLLLFTASRGAAPRENPEAPLAVVLDPRAGGYLRMVFSEVSPTLGIEPVVFWRGRLFVNGRTGLQIYGNGE